MMKWKSILTLFGLAIGLTAGLLAQSVGYMENKGQWDEEIVARYSLANGVAWFMEDRVRIPIVEESVHMATIEATHDAPEGDHFISGHTYEVRFGSATSPASIDLKSRHKDYANFFLGKDRRKWASRVGIYDELHYVEVHEGVDLVWTFQEGNMKLYLLSRPGS